MAIDIREIKSSNHRKAEPKSTNSGLFDFLNKDISFGGSKLKDTKKEKLYNQLGVLFSSGIDLGSALQIIITDEKSKKDKKYFQTIYDDVIKGKAFSLALKDTNQFSDYEYFSIKVGEESGRLNEVLKELSSYFELRVQQRRQLTGALSYPLMVMIVAVVAVIFMLNVVVPMFAGVFQRFGGELPPITRHVLSVSNWLSSNILTLVIIIAGFALTIIYCKRYTWFKKYTSLLILRIPFVGKLTSRILHARFCHSVSLLSLAQVPLLDALNMVKEMIGFYPLKVAIENIRSSIEKGRHMFEGMEEEKLFDPQLISITKVGEEVNRLGDLYAKLYTQYTADVKHMTSVLGNMLEPLMIVFVGVLVMVILIAMYLPLFQLSSSVF